MSIRAAQRRCRAFSTGLVLLFACVGCGGPSEPRDAEGATTAPEDAEHEVQSVLDDLPTKVAQLLAPWRGDLDGMVERRLVRVLTVFDPMLFFLDGPRQRGVVYEAAVELEKTLNKKYGGKRLRVEVLIVPVTRDALLPALVEGRGDIAAANLTITPERLEQVDFTEPLLRDVREVVVAGPGAPALGTLADLAGRRLELRPSSSYWSSVERLNEQLVASGRDPVEIGKMSEWIEDGEILEMVDSKLLPLAVVDSHKARFWAKIYDGLEVREDLAVRSGGEIAWAIRKQSPKLREELNRFVRSHRKGTLFGNVVYKRYLEDNRWARAALEPSTDKRLREMAPLFRKYAEMYDLDWLLIAAQAYQESGMDQSRRSRAGAIGVMQLRPIAAREVGIGDIHKLENNIHAGVKYLRHVMDKYFSDEAVAPVEQHLLGLAAYNAGPSRIRRAQRKAAASGLDPGVWFQNVEAVTARQVGAEPVRYVGNITKYYVAYSLTARRRELAGANSEVRQGSAQR